MRVTLKVLVVLMATLLLVGGAGATAATLITGKQIKDGTITGRDVKDKSLTAQDFTALSIKPVRGPEVEVVPGATNVQAFVGCPEGLLATGGGGITAGGDAVLSDSYPTGTPDPPDGWTTFYSNYGAKSDTVRAWAVCIKLG